MKLSKLRGRVASATITLSKSGEPTAGASFPITVTATGLSGPLVVTPENVSGSASFSPTTATPAPGELVKLFNATWAAAGSASIRATAPGGIVSNTLSVTVSAASPPPPPPPPPPAPAAGQPQFDLLSSTSGAKNVALGFVCRQGQFAAGIVVSPGTFQVTVRNTWSDGSAKFVQVAGSYTSTGGVASTITLASGTASSDPALTTDDLQTALTQPVTVSAGAFGSASWSGSDWATPFQTLTTGHLMSSWTYRKQIGTDAHLVAWVEVRLFAGGAVEVLPWIENGYLSVASPTLKAARVTFTMGGTLRYDSISDAGTPGAYDVAQTVDGSGVLSMPHHTRAVLIRAGATSHWLGTDPGVVPSHDRAYLTSTKLVPAYAPTSINEPSLAALTATYNPGRLAYTSGSMGATGFDSDIGLLPNTSALYLVSGDVRAYKAVIAAGFSLANYCIHYRDQATNRPLLFASHPNKSLATDNGIPATSGGHACLYASSHHPAAAYLPYLLTGWNWFLEEQQFQVTTHYLARNEAYRKNAAYYFNMSAFGPGLNEQSGLRSQGWQLRACAMAATMTPDTDTTMRAQFITVLGYNMGQFREQHESGNADNPFGANTLGAAGNNWDIAVDGWGVWQDAFFTASLGLAWDLDVVSDTTAKANMLWLRDFKYKIYSGLLGRSGVSSEYSFTRAANYTTLKLGTGASVGGGTFNWFTSMGAVWTETWGSPNTDASANTLVGGNIDSGGDGLSTSYWGNIQPAIAYAVDHGSPGALSGYYRMINATNWASRATQFAATPVWGIKPRTADLPYSLPGLGQSVAIGLNNAMSVYPAADGWTTAGWDYSTFGSYGGGALVSAYATHGAYVLAGTGGHNHPDNIGACIFNFTTALWERLDNSNGVARKSITPWAFNDGLESNGSPYYEVTGSVVPLPPHPYANAVALPLGDRGSLVYVTRAALGVGAANSGASHRFDLATRAWSRLTNNISARIEVESDSLYDAVRNRVWLVAATQQNYKNVAYLDLADLAWKTTASSVDFGPGQLAGFKRSMLHDGLIIKNCGAQGLWLFDPDLAGAGWIQLTVTGTLPPVTNNRWARFSNGNWYDFTGDSASNTITRIRPPTDPKTGTWVVDTVAVSGATLPARTQGTPHYTRLLYVPSIDCLAWLAGGTNPVIIFKPGS